MLPCLYGRSGGGRLDALLASGVRRSLRPSSGLAFSLCGLCGGACCTSGGCQIVSLWCGTTAAFDMGMIVVSDISDGIGAASLLTGPEYCGTERLERRVVSINCGVNLDLVTATSSRGLRSVFADDLGGCATAGCSDLGMVASSCACIISCLSNSVVFDGIEDVNESQDCPDCNALSTTR